MEKSIDKLIVIGTDYNSAPTIVKLLTLQLLQKKLSPVTSDKRGGLFLIKYSEQFST